MDAVLLNRCSRLIWEWAKCALYPCFKLKCVALVNNTKDPYLLSDMSWMIMYSHILFYLTVTARTVICDSTEVSGDLWVRKKTAQSWQTCQAGEWGCAGINLQDISKAWISVLLFSGLCKVGRIHHLHLPSPRCYFNPAMPLTFTSHPATPQPSHNHRGWARQTDHLQLWTNHRSVNFPICNNGKKYLYIYIILTINYI